MDPRSMLERRRRFQIAGRWSLAVTLVGSSLALGATRALVLAAISIALSICLVFLLAEARPASSRRAATIVFVLCVATVLFTTLQSIPIPAAFIRTLSPHAADVWSSALSALHENVVGPRPLSLDPTATRVEVLRGTTYLLAFLCAHQVARSTRGVLFLSRVLVVASILVAFAHLAHAAGGAERAYGFVKPLTDVAIVGPFFNANNLAGYLNIGLMIALSSLASSSQSLAPRLALAAVVTLLVVIEVWIGSRGGVASMLVGTLVLSAKVIGQGGRARGYLILLGVGLGGVGMLVLAMSPHAVHLLDRDLSKVAVSVTCFREMVPAYPLFGVGRGAFESTFPEFWTSQTFVVFTHPENIVAQWTTEWGVPFAFVVIMSLGIALRPRVVFARGAGAFGPWLACIVLFIHNLVDFSSEVPSVMIALAVCVAVVVGGNGHVKSRWLDQWQARPRALALVVCVANAIALISVVRNRPFELLTHKASVHALADRAVPDDEFRAAIRDAMLAHPAEPYFPYVGAAHAYETRQSVVPWIERTLSRARTYGPAHLVLARSLHRQHARSQARLEYRLAAEQGFQASAGELASLVESFDDALEVVPASRAGAPTLEAISRMVGHRLPATQWRLEEVVTRRDPSSSAAALYRAHEFLADAASTGEAPWRATEDTVATAQAAIDVAERLDPTSSEPRVLHARLDALGSQPCRAAQQLQVACSQVADRVHCLSELASLAVATKCDPEATLAIDSLARTCPDVDTCTNNLLKAAEVEATRGNMNRAAAFLYKAQRANPNRADVIEAYAAQAASIGLHPAALHAYEHLARLRPDNAAEYERRAQIERRAVAASAEQ